MAMDDLAGQTIGPYHVGAILGESAGAKTYRAVDSRTSRDVALKVLAPGSGGGVVSEQQLEEKARAIASLDHPHILPLLDFQQIDGRILAASPLLDTGTLRDRLHGEPLPLGVVRLVGEQIAGALDYAHTHGLVHGNLKPGNILIDAQGNCLLSDFRLVEASDDLRQAAATGDVLLTPDYAAPEQLLGGPVDRRADVYALGVVLYEMATGRLPFHGESPYATAMAQVYEQPPAPRAVNPRLPRDFAGVLMTALAKDPEHRYPYAADMAAAVRAALMRIKPEFADAPARAEMRTMPIRPIPRAAPPVHSVPPPAAGTAPAIRRRPLLPSIVGFVTVVVAVIFCLLAAAFANQLVANLSGDAFAAPGTTPAAPSSTAARQLSPAASDTPTPTAVIGVTAAITPALASATAPAGEPSSQPTNAAPPAATAQPTATPLAPTAAPPPTDIPPTAPPPPTATVPPPTDPPPTDPPPTDPPPPTATVPPPTAPPPTAVPPTPTAAQAPTEPPPTAPPPPPPTTYP